MDAKSKETSISQEWMRRQLVAMHKLEQVIVLRIRKIFANEYYITHIGIPISYPGKNVGAEPEVLLCRTAASGRNYISQFNQPGQKG